MKITAENAPVTAACKDMIDILITNGPRDRKLTITEVTAASGKVASKFNVSPLDVEHMFSLLFSREIELFPR